MMSNKNRIFFMLLLLSGAIASAATPLETGYSQFQNWLPVVIAAIMVSLMLTGGYYLIGVALNNAKVKGQALGEFYQAIGTVVLVVLIIGVLTIFGTSVTSTKTFLVSPANMLKVCNSPQLSGSQLQFVSSTAQGPTNIICNKIIATASKSNSMTANIDYGLAASYVIAANMTNQTVANLNSLYYIEGLMQWLRTFHSNTIFCLPVTCAIPFNPDNGAQLVFTYMPFQGYIFGRVLTPPIEIMATTLFYMYFMEMVVILLLLYGWPYMLAAGIILRTFFMTRRAGGLIIAVVLVSLLVTPIIVLFEYASLGNSNILCQYGPKGPSAGNPSNCIQLIGTNSIPSMAIHELPLQDTQQSQAITYQLNFFKFPNVAEVLNYYDCYPVGTSQFSVVSTIIGGDVRSDSGILGVEFGFAKWYLTPFGAGAGLWSILGGFAGNAGSTSALAGVQTPPGYQCFEGVNMASTLMDLFNVYGVMGVTGFIMNILNVLFSLSAIVGLSALLGGDTNIIGLGRFV